MAKDLDETAVLTLDLLEARLRALEYVINGHYTVVTSGGTSKKTAVEKLEELEGGLDQLTAGSRFVSDLLELRTRYPDLFQNSDGDTLPSLLTTATKSAIVISTAAAYPLTASSLTSILDTPIPSAETSAKITALGPQVSELTALQVSQTDIIASLRNRTAKAIQRWYSVDVLQSGEYWAEVEGRVDAAEQTFRRLALVRGDQVASCAL